MAAKPIKNRIRQELSIAFLTWQRHLQKQLVPLDITLKQVHLLGVLSKVEFLYPSEIAEKLYCDRPTATVIIRGMEKQGWVTRTKDQVDRRQIQVRITSEGMKKRSEVDGNDQWHTAHVVLDPLVDFSETERKELLRLLKKMNRNLKTETQTAEGNEENE